MADQSLIIALSLGHVTSIGQFAMELVLLAGDNKSLASQMSRVNILSGYSQSLTIALKLECVKSGRLEQEFG